MESGSQERQQTVRDLEKIAVFMDAKFQLPLGFKVGWDGLIGLVPVVGDLVTTFVSIYIVGRAAQLGARVNVILHMLLNILIDSLASKIPLVGWLVDFGWKSNLRNIALVKKHVAAPAETARSSGLLVWGLLTVFSLLTLGLVVLFVFVVMWIVGFIQTAFMAG